MISTTVRLVERSNGRTRSGSCLTSKSASQVLPRKASSSLVWLLLLALAGCDDRGTINNPARTIQECYELNAGYNAVRNGNRECYVDATKEAAK